MKPQRHTKIVGLALGEQSLTAAEVSLGERLDVKRVAEFAYPANLTLAQPAELGAALGAFLRSQGISTKAAVVGIPAKWLAVKSKDVPPADPTTLANILRLQAEGDFSAELKELVYDYAGPIGSGETASVLLVAAPARHIASAKALCEAANLSLVAVTPSVTALGAATGRASGKDAMVLSSVTGGAEFSALHGSSPIALRPLRGATTGELRRAVSAVPTNGSPRELVLWDGGDPESLGAGLGVPVRAGDLTALGVDASTASATNGGRKFATAVAVAVESLGERTPAIDFLHSRLAPPKKPLVPKWALYTAAGVLLAIVIGVLAYDNLQKQQQQLAADQAKLDGMKNTITAADAFVGKVNFAQAWHSGDARYLACVRDLTNALPDDSATYATSLQVHEVTQTLKGGKTIQTGQLAGTLYGKTSDQQRAQMVLDAIRGLPAFTDVKPGGTQDAGRGREVSFSITFVYRPGKG